MFNNQVKDSFANISKHSITISKITMALKSDISTLEKLGVDTTRLKNLLGTLISVKRDLDNYKKESEVI